MAAFAQIGSDIVGTIFGFIGKHHAQAVKNEAAGMNQAIPAVHNSFNTIVSEVNSGMLTTDQAISQLDAIWPQYEDLVYKRFKIKRKNCNGPCVFEKQMKQDAENIKSLLRSGKAGTVTISGINNGRGYNNFPPYLLTYNGPANVIQKVENLLGLESITGNATAPQGSVVVGNVAVPVWIFLVAGGVLVLFAVSSSK